VSRILSHFALAGLVFSAAFAENPARIAPLPGIALPMKGNWGPLPAEYRFEVTSSDVSAADLVQRGFYQLQLFRSPQAARHFHHALQDDPKCAMAWVGYYFAMLESGREGHELRVKALEEAATHKDTATAYEQAWVNAITLLQTKGNPAFLHQLREIRRQWPGERHARAMLTLLLRDGYDDIGRPREGQQEALEILAELSGLFHKDDPVVWHLQVHLAMARPRPSEEDLANARALLAAAPPSAYLRQVAAMLLFRAGHYAEAAGALEAARLFDEQDMAAQGLGAADAPAYLDLVEVQAFVEMEAGHIEKALALARSARQLAIDLTRATAPSTREFSFQILNLEARIHARVGDWKAARAALPPPEHPAFEEGARPVTLVYEALSHYLDGMTAVAEGDIDKARRHIASIEETAAMMLAVTGVAEARGLQPSWSETLNLFDVLLVDLRAHASLATKDRELAEIWWESAARREPALTVRPIPRWPVSIAESRGRALAAGDPAAAAEAIRLALESRPGSPVLLELLTKISPQQP